MQDDAQVSANAILQVLLAFFDDLSRSASQEASAIAASHAYLGLEKLAQSLEILGQGF